MEDWKLNTSLKSVRASNLVMASVCALIAMPFLANPACAQSSGGFTVVLDVAKVFKQNARFDSSMKAIQSEAEKLKTQIQSEQESLKGEAAQVMEQYRPGTPEFQDNETRLEKKQAELRTRARQLNEQLLNKEAKLYHDTYLQMQQVVSQFAQDNNIAMVLRFDSSEVDPANRADVIKAVNRGVVFQRDLDITDAVVAKMGPTTAAIMPNNK